MYSEYNELHGGPKGYSVYSKLVIILVYNSKPDVLCRERGARAREREREREREIERDVQYGLAL